MIWRTGPSFSKLLKCSKSFKTGISPPFDTGSVKKNDSLKNGKKNISSAIHKIIILVYTSKGSYYNVLRKETIAEQLYFSYIT